MPLPIFALFIAAFAFGTNEFVIAGVLPQVADGLGVSIPTAGYLVSAYALGIALGGPVLTVLTGGVPRRTLLIVLVAVFTLGQVAGALAPDFASMILVRIGIAFAHGVYFGVAMVVAVSLVGEQQRGMAVAVVLAGLTVSNIVGVPLGTAIGNAFGWRTTFWAMFGLGLLSLAAMALLLPRADGPRPAAPKLKDEIRVLGRQQVWATLILMQMLMIGQFVPYTYITPLLQEVTGIESGLIPWVLLLNGVGCTLGVFVGGRFTGSAIVPAIIALLVVQAAVMIAMYVLSPLPLPMVAVLFVWGAVNFAIGTPIQTRILTWTADAPNLASSLIPAGFNVGIAFAAGIGAQLLNAGWGYRSLPLLGVAAMAVGVAVAVMSLLAERRSGEVPPTKKAD